MILYRQLNYTFCPLKKLINSLFHLHSLFFTLFFLLHFLSTKKLLFFSIFYLFQSLIYLLIFCTKCPPYIIFLFFEALVFSTFRTIILNVHKFVFYTFRWSFSAKFLLPKVHQLLLLSEFYFFPYFFTYFWLTRLVIIFVFSPKRPPNMFYLSQKIIVIAH